MGTIRANANKLRSMEYNSKSYISGSVQKSQLKYLNASPILPPKELQTVRKRSRSIGEQDKITDYQRFCDDSFMNFSKSVCTTNY